jgi:serine/threonine protein kinase
MNVDPAEARFRAAEAALAEYLERVESGEPLSFQAWKDSRAEIASELERLHAEWRELEEALAASAVPNEWTAAGPIEPLRELEPTASLLLRLRAQPRASDAHATGRWLGAGGMGEVFAVRDAILRRELAMKVLRSDPADALDPGRSARRIARFLEEAQIMAQLDHPGIVPVHELGVDAEGRPFLTMKRVRGRTLADEFARRHAQGTVEPSSLTRCLTHLLRVCEAVAYAHARGVIHRDLKPSNVMLGDHGEVFVMDWGLARVLDMPARAPDADETVASLLTDRSERRGGMPGIDAYTRTGQGLGTAQYMPPEQAMGRWAEVDARADVYAVGAMLYHLLAGRAPYTDSAGTALQIQARVIAGPPLALAGLAPRAAAELVAVCERAMARERDRRYATMSMLASDLRAYLERRVVQAYSTGPLAEARMWVRRNPTAALTTILLVLSVGAAGLFMARSTNAARERDDAQRLAQSVRDTFNARKTLTDLEIPDARFIDAIVEARRVDSSLLASHGPVHEAQLSIAAKFSENGFDIAGRITPQEFASRWREVHLLEPRTAEELARAALKLRIWLEVTRIGHAARLADARYPAHLKRPETRALAERILEGDRSLIGVFHFLEALLDRIELSQGDRQALEVTRAFFERGSPIPPVHELWDPSDDRDMGVLALLPLIAPSISNDHMIEFLEALLERNPGVAHLHYDLGTWRLRAGDREGAVESLEVAVSLRPDWAPARAQLSGALCPSLNGDDILESIHHAREAIRFDPTWGTGWVNLSAALLGPGKHAEAADAATRAIELMPSSSAAYFNRAVARQRMDQLDDAITDCERALELRPDYPRAAGVLAELKAKIDARIEQEQ